MAGDDLPAIERARVWASIYEGWQDVFCGGDCRVCVPPGEGCLLPQADIVMYNSTGEMKQAGWGRVRNKWTAYEWADMCPRCFKKYWGKDEG